MTTATFGKGIVSLFYCEDAVQSSDPEKKRKREIKRNALLMYTSCGWFFDDLAGIETVQCLAYAARVLELYEETGKSLEAAFLQRLATARSNLPKDGEDVFCRLKKLKSA